MDAVLEVLSKTPTDRSEEDIGMYMYMYVDKQEPIRKIWAPDIKN